MIQAVHDPELVGEPTLEELFAEPIIRLIMARDGVEDSSLLREIDRVREHYHAFDAVQ